MDLASFRRQFWQNAFDARHPFASLVRWPVWLMHIVFRRRALARFRTGGLTMEVAPRLTGFGSTSIYIKRDHYEPELLAVGRLIEPGSVALDIGASFGIFSLFMAHFAGREGKVHAFEPGGYSFGELQANVARNNAANIVLHRMAASDRPATLKLAPVGGAPVTFSIGDAPDAEEVPAGRVDEAVPPEDAARVGFIKIDVEGYEIAALEGARGILERSRPTVMFEVCADSLARQRQTPADIYGFLAAFGYRFWILERGRFVPVNDHREGNIFAALDIRA